MPVIMPGVDAFVVGQDAAGEIERSADEDARRLGHPAGQRNRVLDARGRRGLKPDAGGGGGQIGGRNGVFLARNGEGDDPLGKPLERREIGIGGLCC